ncbi:MAG: VCBS repeat-containing protein [Chloroflexota bacterium]
MFRADIERFHQAPRQKRIGYLLLTIGVSALMLTILVGSIVSFLRPTQTVQAAQLQFQQHVPFGSSFECSYDIAIGDVNNDGTPDIISANTLSLCDTDFNRLDAQNTVAFNIEVNRISGYFSSQAIDPVGLEDENTFSIAKADMDGDGDLDIVSVNGFFSSDTFGIPSGEKNYIFFNDGQGTYDTGNVDCSQPSSSYVCFGEDNEITMSVALGDVNGDGHIDVVTTNLISISVLPYVSSSNMKVYFNNGSGQLLPTEHTFESIVATIPLPFSIRTRLVDLDKNGTLDLVSGNMRMSGFRNFEGATNKIYMNDGTGLFDSGSAIEFGGDDGISRGVSVADINGDDHLDIVIANGFSFKENDEYITQQNYYYIKNGTANEWVEYPISLGAEQFASLGLAVGDVNNDTRNDIVIGNFRAPNLVYLNTGGADDSLFLDESDLTFGVGADATTFVELADMNSDGSLDIVVGNIGQNLVYLNEQATDLNELPNQYQFNFGNPDSRANDMAYADLNDDGFGDLIIAIDGKNHIYFGQANGFPSNVHIEFGNESDASYRVEAADVNGDDAIDIIVGNLSSQNQIFINDGNGNFPTDDIKLFGPPNSDTYDLAVADLDGDNALDIITSNLSQKAQIHFNQGDGEYLDGQILQGNSGFETLAVGVADVDADGDVDVAISNLDFDAEGVLYLNNGLGQFDDDNVDCSTPSRVFICFGEPSNLPFGISFADVNNDGAVDMILANDGQQNLILINDGGDFSTDIRPFGNGSDLTHKISVGDLNSDGFVDIVASNGFLLDPVGKSVIETFGEKNAAYMNDGTGHFPLDSTWIFGEQTTSSRVILGDINKDGLLDFIENNYEASNKIFLNPIKLGKGLTHSPPKLFIHHPDLGLAGQYKTSNILSGTVPIPFTISNPAAGTIRSVRAFYSPDGGGQWFEAVHVNGAQLENLAMTPQGETYIFEWDVIASGFFGQSDNVVFRLEAFPQTSFTPNNATYIYENQTPRQDAWSYASATTFPFRVRGKQIRVIDSNSNLPAAASIVYHLPVGNNGKANLISDNQGAPFTTNTQGFLGGRGMLQQGDQIIALHPVTSSMATTYTLYHMSGAPINEGLAMTEVGANSVEQLEVSADNPLILFDIGISLEWDATNDIAYREQLEADIKYTSDILFDISNGQVALGNVYIFHDREYWLASHVQLFASNVMLPNADAGGIVTVPTSDTQKISETITIEAYYPGQIRMPATWNRYGLPGGNPGEDWPRVFAHELAHYLLFQLDNYLGVDESSGTPTLVQIENCDSIMTDAFGSSEFASEAEWLADCQNTLAQYVTKRSDLQTLEHFFPMLNTDVELDGPLEFPLGATVVLDEAEPSAEVLDLTIQVRTADGTPITTSDTRIQGYLIKSQGTELLTDDLIIPQGSPQNGLLQVRGAERDDLLCVVDNSLEYKRVGCDELSSTTQRVELKNIPGWAPDIQVFPVTSRTLAITVTQQLTPSQSALTSLNVQVFPSQLYTDSDYVEAPTATLSLPTVGQNAVTFTTQIELEEPSNFGNLRFWVPNSDEQEFSNYYFGGAWGPNRPGFGPNRPGFGPNRPGFGANRTWWGMYGQGFNAPLMSANGQVMVIDLNHVLGLTPPFVLEVQTFLPDFPIWLTPVGEAYHFISPGEIENTSNSILFNYLERNVPNDEFESELKIYYLLDGEIEWQAATAQQLDVNRNLASTALAGNGIYVLAAAVNLGDLEVGLQQFSYPISGERPIETALASIEGMYDWVYHFDNTTQTWEFYQPALVNTYPFFAPLVNQLDSLKFAHSYWISMTQSTQLIIGFENASQGTLNQPVDSSLIPPVTVFGEIDDSIGFDAMAGMDIQAVIDGQICGHSIVQEVNGRLIYLIQVEAASPTANRCGRDGQFISFNVDGSSVDFDLSWQYRGAIYHPLGGDIEPFNSFLPIVKAP